MISLAYRDSYKTILESNNAKLGNYGFEYMLIRFLLRKEATMFPSSVVSFYKLKKAHLLIYNKNYSCEKN